MLTATPAKYPPLKMTREEALHLAATSDVLARDPGATCRSVGVSRQSVSRIIQAIPLGKCPAWLVERRPKPQSQGIELQPYEVRELAELMLGQKGHDLTESIDRCWAVVSGGGQPTFGF